MDSIKKKIFCEFLDTEAEVIYYYMDIKGSSGNLVKRKILYSDCGCKRYCQQTIHYSTCPCFQEWIKVEEEINKI